MQVAKHQAVVKERGDTYYYRSSWVQLIRPLTLTGTITPILAGSAFAYSQGAFRLDLFIGVLLASLFIQSAANMLNDYFDFSHGQDEEKWTTEHTGERNRIAHHSLPKFVIALLIIASFIGLWLALNSSLWLLVIGIVSMFAGNKYSAGSHSFSAKGLGELAAAIFLGTVVTTVAYIVQGHSLDGSILAISLPYSFLIASLILTNNLRDIEKDRPFRETIAIRLGRESARKLLIIFIICAYLSVFLFVYFTLVSWHASFVLFAIPIAIKLLLAFRSEASREEEYNGMKWAAWHHWTFGLLFAGSLWLSVFIALD